MARIIESIRNMVSAALVAAAVAVGVTGALMITSIAGPMVVGSYSHYREMLAQHEPTPLELKRVRDRWAYLDCPAFNRAGVLERARLWTVLSWCRGYPEAI
ncbi:hypothetical protein FY136_28730 (plasmid) [Agrobacterium tumefaciens]|uniref:hypothetical protein n=1 Tax=Agrobacterium tumefaciens TaxID=358 RepID=UPI0021D1FEE2|nr:hypothetical protein [Agrobacterium tumefaciens]UXT53249.1 hypothetical protein FY136_28730 [Agrobacterium tumefaciens]